MPKILGLRKCMECTLVAGLHSMSVGSATDLWQARASQTMEQNNDNFCFWQESVAGQTHGMYSGLVAAWAQAGSMS